jgi:hypothetical protein
LKGSLYMKNGSVEFRSGRAAETMELPPLPPERAEPIACLVNSVKTGKAIEGLTALEINVGVVEIIEAAKMSVASGNAVGLPLKT